MRTECPAEIHESRRPKMVEETIFIRGEKAGHESNAAKQRGTVGAKNEEQNGGRKIGPTDQAKNAIPACINMQGVKGKDVVAVTIGKNQRAVKHSSEPKGADTNVEYFPEF